MPVSSPVRVIQQAQLGISRSAVRRHLQTVASGKATSLSIDLDQGGIDIGALVEEITDVHLQESIEAQRLVVAFINSGVADQVIERLAAKSPQQRARSARTIGALRIYESVPWIAGLLESRDRTV